MRESGAQIACRWGWGGDFCSDKTINDNYYLLTLAALVQEIRSRGAPTECTVRIAAGLPLTSYGRDKPKFRSYLLRPSQPVQFRYESVEYRITIADV